MQAQRGKFIVLQGLDRTGKSSITRFIFQKLSQKSKTVTKSYPDRTTEIGKMINNFLISKLEIGNEAVHLLFSANRWQTSNQLNSILNQGTNIVCDRYWYSGVAYSSAKGLDFQWCVKPDQGLVEPDLIIYLSADPVQLSKRKGYGQERFEKVDFQTKVGQNFNKIFDSKVNKEKLVKLQVGTKTLQQVQAQVQKLLTERSFL